MAVICVIIASFVLAGVPTIAQNPTVSEAIVIEARGGDNVTLPCDQVLPTPAPDFPIALYVLQWKRQGTALPLYVIFDSTDPIINPAYERRVSLVEGGASLLMANVTAADAGIYECQLIVLGEESTIGNGTFVNLTILGPPKFNSTPPDHVVYQEDSEASLQCRANGVPFPVVKWKRQGELITSNSRITVAGDTITIKRVVRSDVGTYTCVAENGEGYVTNDTRFVVEGPPYIFVPPEDTSVTLGQSATLTCEALASPDNLTQQWFYEGLLVQNVEQLNQRVEVNGAGELLIRGTQREDRGIYSCTPTNGIGIPPTASAFLDVQYAAQVVSMPTIVYATHGEDAIIPCNTSANPALLYAIWRKDEAEIRITQTSRYSTSEEGSLIIEEATLNDQGSYTCTPYNDLGTAGQSTPTSLIVIDPPEFSVQPEAMYEKSIDDSVSMPCNVIENTVETRLTWRKVNGELSIRAVITENGLDIVKISKDDHGTYECVATNQVATVIASADLVVSPTSPHTPTNVAVVTSSTSAYISWESGYDGGRTQTFAIRYRQMGTSSDLWTTIHSIPATYISMLIYNLMPSTLYEFTVTASNNLGESEPSETVTATTKDPDSFVHPTDSTGATIVPLPEDIKPSPPENVTLTTDKDGLYLSWLPPSLWSDYVDHYTIEYRIIGPWLILEDRISVDTTRVLLRNLQPNKTYHFRVFAFTVATFSDPSLIVEGDTQDLGVYIPTPTFQPRSSTPGIIAGVIGGLCFLLIALLLFTMAIIISHRKKEKKKRYFFSGQVESQTHTAPNNTNTAEPRPSAIQKSLTKLKIKLSPKPNRASPSLSDPSATTNGSANGHQTTATLRPQKRSFRDRILSRSMDPRSASYRVESEREEEVISTVSRRLDYGHSSVTSSRMVGSDGDVNDITLIPTNSRENSEQNGFLQELHQQHRLQHGSETSFPSTSSGREDQPLTNSALGGQRRHERGDYVYYHGQMLLSAMSSDDDLRGSREGTVSRDGAMRQPGDWGSQTLQTFGQKTPPRYTHAPDNPQKQAGKTQDTSLWTEDMSEIGPNPVIDRQMHRHSTRKDLQAARVSIQNYSTDVPRMRSLSPSALDSMSTIAGSVSGRSITPTPMEFQEYPTGASYEYSSQQQPSPEVPHPRKASPYKDMIRASADVYSDPSIVSVSPLGSRDFTSAGYQSPYDTDVQSSRFSSYVHSDVFSPSSGDRTFRYPDDGYDASQDVSNYQRTQSKEDIDVRLEDSSGRRSMSPRSVTPRSMTPRSMTPRSMTPRAKSPRSSHWRSPSTQSYASTLEDPPSQLEDTLRPQTISPITAQNDLNRSQALSPSVINNSHESFASIEGGRDQSLVGPLPSFAPRRTLSPISQHSLSSGYGSRNTSQSTTNTSSIRGRRSFPSMEEVQEEREDTQSPVSDTKRDDSTDENYEFDKGLDTELMEALKRYYEPEKIIVDDENGEDVKPENAEKRCEELKKEFEEYRKKQALIEDVKNEAIADIAREVYKPPKLTSTV
nr:protein turtle homolog A-like [Lytechinus pictus]